MNQGEMDYQSAADQSHAGLAILLLLGRAMPWLVFFAVATLGSTLPEQLNPTPCRKYVATFCFCCRHASMLRPLFVI